ncbi:MAG: LVIVD repeat-containing protein, partial [Actinomycetota bacterium]
VDSGRAARGFSCNAQPLSRFGPDSGGYRVHRYVDRAGRECAYYDSTLLFPSDVFEQRDHLPGVFVLDMSDPRRPVKTDNLVTPAMLTPHESMSINTKRGLLGAVMGNPLTTPSFLDLYDLSQDCRHPVLQSSTPVPFLGHEGNFAPDGKTFYATSTAGMTMTAIDVSNPSIPVPLWVKAGVVYHGLNISDDGKRAYVADIGDAGLTILDTSQIQARTTNPQVPVVAHLTWPEVSIPQTAIPVTIRGHRYLIEVDEFAGGPSPSAEAAAEVGAARIIDIANDRKPKVVSNIRLEVHMPKNRPSQMTDPGAENSLQGYAGHYCAVPRRNEPGIVACTFILSGLRVFDIREPRKPREVAYFNAPQHDNLSAAAMSAPAFAPERKEIWYSDGSFGFHALKVANGAWK